MQLNRRNALRVAGLGVVTAVGLPRRAHAADNVIKVGVIQPQQGDCAQWGIPITRAVQMWAEDVTGTDGFLAGDGKRYKIEVTGYDNGCYSAGDELKAARRAILDDKIHYLLQTYTPSCRQAIGPLTNETKTLVTSYGAGFLGKDYPYLLGAQTGEPTGNMLTISYVLSKHPNIKKVALLTGDTSFGKAARAYMKAGIAPHAATVEIVNDTSYGSSATNDMLGLLTPLAASNPDLIYEMGLTPGPKATMVATMEQLGYKGLYCSESWETNFLIQSGVMDAVAGRIFSGPAVDAQEPTFSPRAHAFYKRYVAKYGAAEWISWASNTYGAMVIFEIGWKASPSVDPETTMKTLYAMNNIDHPIFGPSKWGGEEIFGANHHLLTPVPIYGANKDGSPVVDGIVPTADWWAKNKAVALPQLKAGGQIYG
jgi:branched-chain amino acid transport system substrate-binding protein